MIVHIVMNDSIEINVTEWMNFSLVKGTPIEEFVIFYWNISKGTKAKTRGNGGNWPA